jgi:hypothetical protein
MDYFTPGHSHLDHIQERQSPSPLCETVHRAQVEIFKQAKPWMLMMMDRRYSINSGTKPRRRKPFEPYHCFPG